jgi:hypothetical protein
VSVQVSRGRPTGRASSAPAARSFLRCGSPDLAHSGDADRRPWRRLSGVNPLAQRQQPPGDRHPLLVKCTPAGTVIPTAPAKDVLAKRKPRLLFRLSVVFLLRLAARRFCGLLFQEPPRTTRRQGAVQASRDVADTSRPGRSHGASAKYLHVRHEQSMRGCGNRLRHVR